MLVLSVTPVFAQEADISNMTNEQLLLLLQSIMQKLEQDETSSETVETASSGPAGGPLAVNDTETAPTFRLFRIYENKKLIIEALPDYMFVQPEKETEEPEKEKKKDKDDDDGTCPPLSLCAPGIYCSYYVTPEGKCVCMCG